MRPRTIATLLATVALVVGVLTCVLIATPAIGYALSLQRPDDAAPVDDSTAAAAERPSAVSTPTSGPTSNTPSPTYSGPLIAPPGSRQISRQQLHNWVASRPFFGQDPDNDRIWEQQQWLDIKCMARKGFLDDPTNPNLQDHQVSTKEGLTPKQVKDYSAAMDGPPTDAPYDWRTAGCHGRSVHLTGQDNAH